MREQGGGVKWAHARDKPLQARTSGYAQQPGVDRFLSARGGTVARFPRMLPKLADTSPLVLSVGKGRKKGRGQGAGEQRVRALRAAGRKW